MNTDKVMVTVELRAAQDDGRIYKEYALMSEHPGMLTWPVPLVCWN